MDDLDEHMTDEQIEERKEKESYLLYPPLVTKRPRGRPRKDPDISLQTIDMLINPLGPEFGDMVKRAMHTLVERDAHYSGNDKFSNFKSAEKLGLPPWLSVMNRMEDKISRAENQARLIMGGQDAGDIEDTLIDLANYALIAAMLVHKAKREVKK